VVTGGGPLPGIGNQNLIPSFTSMSFKPKKVYPPPSLVVSCVSVMNFSHLPFLFLFASAAALHTCAMHHHRLTSPNTPPPVEVTDCAGD